MQDKEQSLSPPRRVLQVPHSTTKKRIICCLENSKEQTTTTTHHVHHQVVLPPASCSRTLFVCESSEKAKISFLVSQIYSIIRKYTGSLGGHGYGGAIYGEITTNSFQRVVDVLKQRCFFNTSSKFLDIGESTTYKYVKC
jgi:hypothetical protein